MANVSEMAPCHIVTSRPEGTTLYLQRGFILAQDGPVELGDQYLDESTRATPVRANGGDEAAARSRKALLEPEFKEKARRIMMALV